MEDEGEKLEGGKRVGVAIDFSECSKKALKWTIDNLLHNGDHLILICVRTNSFYEHGEMQLWETIGTPLLTYDDFSNNTIMKKYEVMPDADTLEVVNKAAQEKQINPLLKIYWGEPGEKLCEAVDTIPLTSVVIGNRGLGALERVVLGSVSNYVVNNATCPVTVVH